MLPRSYSERPERLPSKLRGLRPTEREANRQVWVYPSEANHYLGMSFRQQLEWAGGRFFQGPIINEELTVEGPGAVCSSDVSYLSHFIHGQMAPFFNTISSAQGALIAPEVLDYYFKCLDRSTA